MSRYPIVLATLFAALAAASPQRAQAQAAGITGGPERAFDVRLAGGSQAAQLKAQLRASLKDAPAAGTPSLAAAWVDLSTRMPGARLRVSPATGGVAALWNEHGALSPPAPSQSSTEIVHAFLRAEGHLFGLLPGDAGSLAVVGDSPGGVSGLRMLRLEQRIDGVPVFESETRFLIDRQGQVRRVLGSLLPGAALAAAKHRPAWMAPADAVAHLLGGSGRALEPKSLREVGSTDGGWIELAGPSPLAGAAHARQVWFVLAPEILVPAWALTVHTEDAGDWYALVDAASGTLLWRKDLRDYASTQQARFSVYVQADGVTPADSPAPQSPSAALPGGGTQYPGIARSTVGMLQAQVPAASPNGWIDDCPSAANGCDSTRGNNVVACLDRDASANVCDTGALDADGRALGNPDAALRNRDFLGAAPRDFEYSPAPLAGNPDAGDNPTNPDSQRGALVQAFYTVNWFHDRMLHFGFDEGAGNFQQANLLGQGGLGGDRIAADVQNSGANSASFSTPADGAGPGRMELSIHTGPNPDRDSALDAGIILHELTHGMTHRLVGNSQGLLWDVARGMGEGWSDFYALALLNPRQSDDPNARHVFAPWVTYKLGALSDNYVYGYRRFPYSTDAAFNPLDFADIDAVTADEGGGIAPSPLNLGARGVLEVHNAGTVWGAALWRLRAALIADPAGANGDVAAGNETALQLVTDALKMTPANPSLVDGRDALIAADCATHACAHELLIWQSFAALGLGYKAVAPLSVLGRYALAHMGVGTSHALPHLDVLDVAADVVVDDSVHGNADGRLDPGETVDLRIALSNPLHRAGLTATGVAATLSTTSADLSVQDALAQYPDIPAQARVLNGGDVFSLRLAGQAACGSALPLRLTTVSSLGARAFDFTLRVGTRGGSGAPLTFSSAPGLAIPVSSLDGVSADLDIAADHEIADLDFRVDNLSHPVTGHLSVMLRAPNGYGTDLIFRRGGFMVPNQGEGANFVAVRIDDDLPNTAAEDLNQSLSTQAPFTGDWLPAFNGPFWNSYRPSPPSPPAQVQSDTIGQLARLDGGSSQGRWTINVANGSNTLTGTLHAWSLIITPRSFSCTVHVPGPLLFANGFENAASAPPAGSAQGER